MNIPFSWVDKNSKIHLVIYDIDLHHIIVVVLHLLIWLSPAVPTNSIENSRGHKMVQISIFCNSNSETRWHMMYDYHEFDYYTGSLERSWPPSIWVHITTLGLLRMRARVPGQPCKQPTSTAVVSAVLARRQVSCTAAMYCSVKPLNSLQPWLNCFILSPHKGGW